MIGEIVRRLEDGLVVRRAAPEDAEAVADFNARTMAKPDGEPSERIRAWTSDLMDGRHPTTGAGDFTLVEKTQTGEIVSSMCLIDQTWTYDGIPFTVGRPEIVSTNPEYRKRGLVRAQFDVLHGWSAERGQLVTAITGIPWFYRQFGYEMAIDLEVARCCHLDEIPDLPAGETETYVVRPATAADVGVACEAYGHGTRRGPIACVRDAAYWRYSIAGCSDGNINRSQICVIETAGGEPVGLLAHWPRVAAENVKVLAFELLPGVPWGPAGAAVLRYLRSAAGSLPLSDGAACKRLRFVLGSSHPLYDALGDRLVSPKCGYAWYVRVPDLTAFLQRVAPALEARLAGSCCAGHTGKLTLDFYRSGVQLAFEHGRLSAVEAWKPQVGAGGDASFPDLTFLQLLFGHRGFCELAHAFPDCWTHSEETVALLDALWPRRPSTLWGVD